MADLRHTLLDFADPNQVTSLVDVNPRLSTSLKTIARLAQLEDNWDGYGSPPLLPVAIARAIHVLKISDKETPPVPHIGPVTGGGIQIEWSTTARDLELEILPEGSLEYVLVDETGQTDEGEIPANDDERILDLVRRLVHSSSNTNLR
jgi:hypothetical protein